LPKRYTVTIVNFCRNLEKSIGSGLEDLKMRRLRKARENDRGLALKREN
jgi:hypothetical protein